MMQGGRFRFLMVLLPLIAVALGSFWLYEVLRRATETSGPARERTEPDFYVEKFSYAKIAANGSTQYQFTGARLTHNPQDGSYDIEQPVVTKIGSQGEPTTLVAERAHVNSDNSRVDLYNNVRMERPATAQRKSLRVSSEYMQLLPDDDVVKTDKPVSIAVGNSILNGTGMYANNATRELRLSRNVHGTYQPMQR